MDRHELMKLFWSDVEAVASGFDLRIDEGCEQRLRAFIGDGVDRLAYEELLNNPRRIGQAETHLIAFVGGMAFQARMENLRALNVFIFEAARKTFCPLWPFC
jgi:hypothetical protein